MKNCEIESKKMLVFRAIVKITKPKVTHGFRDKDNNK